MAIDFEGEMPTLKRVCYKVLYVCDTSLYSLYYHKKYLPGAVESTRGRRKRLTDTESLRGVVDHGIHVYWTRAIAKRAAGDGADGSYLNLRRVVPVVVERKHFVGRSVKGEQAVFTQVRLTLRAHRKAISQ